METTAKCSYSKLKEVLTKKQAQNRCHLVILETGVHLHVFNQNMLSFLPEKGIHDHQRLHVFVIRQGEVKHQTTRHKSSVI